jgi:hypothetical protein
MQSHPDAHGHPADELGARGHGVDDAPDGEHTKHPRDADLAGVSVDSNLGELGAKGMPRPIIIDNPGA